MAQPRPTDDFQPVANEDDLDEGDLLEVDVGGERIVLIRHEGEVYAMGRVCTHLGGNLAEGWIDGDMIRCPLHNSGFDIRTGQAVRPPAKKPEPMYPVRIEGGRIWVSPTRR